VKIRVAIRVGQAIQMGDPNLSDQSFRIKCLN
jgi:hypothetical protein